MRTKANISNTIEQERGRDQKSFVRFKILFSERKSRQSQDEFLRLNNLSLVFL